MGKSRTPRKAPPRRSSGKRARTRLRRPETLFAIFAVLTVVSLIAAAIGTTIIDELTQAGDDNTTEINDDDVDAYEQSLRDAADANPDDPAALKELASYLSTTGQLSEAIGWYEKALALNPNDVILRLAFADALKAGGKRPDAELQYQKSIETQPNNPQAHFGLGELYEQWSPPRTQDAIAAYQKTIEVGGDSYVAELAAQKLATLNPGTPSPEAGPATPEGAATP
jgi:tetratricopeptide (TPR) repeat protein